MIDKYSVKEAAAAINCSTTFIYGLIKSGVVGDYKVGNRHYIPAEDINRYITQNTSIAHTATVDDDN